MGNALKQAKLETERRIITLQREHEAKLHLMLRHFAEETSSSSGVEGVSRSHFILDSYAEVGKYKRENKNLKKRIQELEAVMQMACHSYTPPSAGSGEDGDISTTPDDMAPDVDLRQEIYHNARNRGWPRNVMSAQKKIGSSSSVQIPQQNLKRLQISSTPSTTKVTRQKNKLIIQQQKKS
uniref:Uncharacterized protein n=1 Tax=Timema poppense TaxID=170557 RepID=A0A7R9DAE1_TIMPO|nr:unnamed protein product [Timema poppensis]